MTDDLQQESLWWWIDYLEDELDPTMEKNLQFLLENSQEDRDSFEQFRLLREWLRQCDPVEDMAISEERLLRMRRKVMLAVKRENNQAAFFETKSLSI